MEDNPAAGCAPAASADATAQGNHGEDLNPDSITRLPGLQTVPKSSARRPTVPPRWGPTASGDGSVSGEGAVSSHGNSTQNPNHVANAWDGWFNTGHSMDEMFNQHLYSGDYDYTSWSQAWHNSWQAWPWPGSKGSMVRPPNAVQTEVQQRKAEEQEQQEWEKKLAEAIDTDVLAGLKMLLEGRGSGTAGESPSPPRPELVAKILERAAVQGPVALVEVAEGLFGTQSGAKMTLDIPTYAGMLQRLVLDPACYRPAAVRLLLNVALSKESPVVPVAPGILTDSETVICERNVQDKDIEEEEEKDEVGKEWPEELVFRNSGCWPELNGVFKRTRDFDHVSQHQRPTYERMVSARSGDMRLLCFFWEYSCERERGEQGAQNDAGAAGTAKKRRRRAVSVERGWWLGKRMGGADLMGKGKPGNSELSELPTGADWQLKPPGVEVFQADPGGFVDQEQLGIEALQRLNLSSLQGHVVSPQGVRSARYFGHFCSLLHLEYLQEVATLRRRASRRSGEELERGGWALTGMRVRDVVERPAKGKGRKGSGKGATSGFQMFLWLPPKTDIDRLRFRKGDSIILSATHPLQDRLAEGQLQDITDKWVLLSFEEVSPPQGCKQRLWRVDKGSNRLSYARQLDSLVSLCTGYVDSTSVGEDCSKIFEIIRNGNVGQADSWASRVWSDLKETAVSDSTAKGDESQVQRMQTDAPRAELAEAFKPGEVVTLHGLQADLNQQGEVVAVNGSIRQAGEHAVEGEDVRINVQVNGSVKAVRVSNLKKVDSESTADSSAKAATGTAATAAEKMICDAAMLTKCVESIPATCTDSQRRAVAATCERRLTIIQGPPGTGKTATAVQILRSWAQLGLKPLLAVADGNIAVDNIAAGLAKQGVDVRAVRVGRPEKIRPELEEITLDNQLRRMKKQKQEQKAAEERAAAMAVLEQTTLRDLKLQASDLNARILPSTLQAAQVSDQQAKGSSEEQGEGEQMHIPAARVLELALESICTAEASKAEAAAAEILEARTEAEAQHQEQQKRIQARREDAEMQLQALREADVLCAQLITAGGGLLAKLGPFKGILIDEIAQATEIVSLVPIVQRRCERVVLAGDHCQLPPTVQSQEAERRGLTLSLYGRLVQEGLEPYFLDTQFRSHPKLVEWVASSIYGGRLKSGIHDGARPPMKGFDWPRKKVPVAFVEMGRASRESQEHESKMNSAEAERVVHIIESVLDAGCTAEDLGVVTPYMAQVRLLRTSWRNRCKERGMKWNASKNSRTLEIASVDNFQGREKELIVFSAVRNNAAGRVGFLADWRRLNVMLTRARRGLVVVGHGLTLKKDPYWLQWLGWCESHRVIVDKQAWHDIVRAAKRAEKRPHVKSLLHNLFEFEQAPQTEKAFCKFVKEHLGDRCQGPDEAEMLWQAVTKAREEASAAAQRRSNEEELPKMLTEVAIAKPADIPKLRFQDLGDPDPNRRSRWRSWKFVAQEFLWAPNPEHTWSWQELKEKMHDYYQTFLTASNQTDNRSKKQLFREMRQSLPEEWFVKDTTLQVQLKPLDQQQAARMVWKANRQDGVRGFQHRALPWMKSEAAKPGENETELGIQISTSKEPPTLNASPSPKKRKRKPSNNEAKPLLEGGHEPGQSAAAADAPDEDKASSLTSSKVNLKRRKKTKPA